MKPTNYEEFAECVRDLYRQAGNTFVSLSKQTGLPSGSLSKISKGKRWPRWNELQRFSPVIDVSGMRKAAQARVEAGKRARALAMRRVWSVRRPRVVLNPEACQPW